MSTFKPGDRVYHRTLKRVGKFIYRSRVEPNEARVEFDDDPDYPQGRLVSFHLLERA